MMIRNMFQEDINRQINGVIKVDQSSADVIEQEVKEYVITKELKRHFMQFFDYYDETFERPTADIGVWISGFFGSGKSHFLKMLSYILENREIGGKKTVEFFRDKFADDAATFMLIDKATKAKTETILFNIDIEGPSPKDKTAVLRVFAKMFYNHLGYYGGNLKVARLEQYLAKQGKLEEFRHIFEERHGSSWLSSRDGYAFCEDDVIYALQQVLNMSETAARNWFYNEDESDTELSISKLVSEIKEFVCSQPSDFRLLFMIDEVGQYIGSDTDLLLNLQSLVEKLGSECGGHVWVVCTGQEAIDEIIKVRENEFSRIQARFKNRLSLTSSSVAEVVQKRILKKTPSATNLLEDVYRQSDSVLRNLFTFNDAMSDIKGYSGPENFVINYPFIPYQFILMQRVFNEIRKHGNAGSHHSDGERSMLSGFQETAQKVQLQDEWTLVPFFMFYDTLHSFLDSSIRRVIERCQQAADNHDGIEDYDVSVLKLLYLVRYLGNDIKATPDNIVILMADSINVDKIATREKVNQSLGRLLGQNYIGRSGNVYNFLTDEEQDVQIEIKRTAVDTSEIVKRIAEIIYGDIYTSKKFRYKDYDFAFDQMVDGICIGATGNGIGLRFLTIAADDVDKSELRLQTESSNQAIVVLENNQYYSALEQAMKIRKYTKQRLVPSIPKSVQDIIRSRQDEASEYEKEARQNLITAIESAKFYAAGEHIPVKTGDVKAKIDQALEYLVVHVYRKLDLIEEHVSSDAEVCNIAKGLTRRIDGCEPNQSAVADVAEYLDIQEYKHLPTSMQDIQSRYQAIPYGWKEIDIAGIVAMLLRDQKATIKYAGTFISPDESRLAELLRKKSEIGKVVIRKRVMISAQQIRNVREFLREYFDCMDVPEDEDGIIKFIKEKFFAQCEHYRQLLARYDHGNYPNKQKVQHSLELIETVLSQAKDNNALVGKIVEIKTPLLDNKDDMQLVEAFFEQQVTLFDRATRFEAKMTDDKDYISKDAEANTALNTIRAIINMKSDDIYRRIPELNGLIDKVNSVHEQMLLDKKEELTEYVRQCMERVHQNADVSVETRKISNEADKYFDDKKQEINGMNSLALLDGMVQRLLNYTDAFLKQMNAFATPKTPSASDSEPKKPKAYKQVFRNILFPAETLETRVDIDKYVNKIRAYLENMMENSDGIEIK